MPLSPTFLVVDTFLTSLVKASFTEDGLLIDVSKYIIR